MDTMKAYLELTKPRVIELLLIATIPAMLQAQRGEPNLGLILLTLIGGWMGAGAANAFNMVVDWDIDQKMGRTRARPLVRNKLTGKKASIFAVILMVASFFWLWLLCDSLLAAAFVLFTIWFYIYPYTKWLKRRTSQNVVWGGIAGCMPVAVGWAVIAEHAPIDELSHWWQAVALFLIIFFWTPPHTWALAMKYRDDYERAGVPMLPVVKPAVTTSLHILWYTIGTVAVSFALIPAASWIYAVVAVISGVGFVFMAIQLYRGVSQGEKVKPLKLFIISNNYLSVLFVALAADAIVGWTTLGEMWGWSTTLF